MIRLFIEGLEEDGKFETIFREFEDLMNLHFPGWQIKGELVKGMVEVR